MEPDLRDGQRCCEKVSLWATGRGALKVVECKAMLGRENSLFHRHESSQYPHLGEIGAVLRPVAFLEFVPRVESRSLGSHCIREH